MKFYIDREPNPSGGYPNPKHEPFEGCIPLNEEQSEMFLEYNGFVTVTQTGDTVTVEPNFEAWEKWKESLPDPNEEPETEPDVWDEMAAAIAEGVNEV